MAGTLTITNPATDSAPGYSSSTVHIFWSFVGTAGAVQTQRRVWMFAVGSSAIVYDTGMAAATETDNYVAGFSTGVSYQVNVSVIDTAGATTTTSRVIVSTYTRSLPSVLTVTDAGDAIAIQCTNATGGSRPAVASQTVYRRRSGIYEDWTLIDTCFANGTVFDRTAAAGQRYDYMSRTDTGVDSDPVTGVLSMLAGAWIYDTLASGTTYRNFPYSADNGSETIDVEETLLQFVGRTYPVVETGEHETHSVALSVTIPRSASDFLDQIQWWRDRKRTASTLFYRDGRGRALAGRLVGALTLGGSTVGAVITATIQRVDYFRTTILAASYNSPANNDGGFGTGGFGSTGFGN